MDTQTVRFTFDSEGDRKAVEEDIGLALFAATCIYGEPGVRLGARYLVSPDGKRCVASVAGPAGEAVVRVFTGLCAIRLGDEGFRVEQIARDQC